jgi:hypothetical protein
MASKFPNRGEWFGVLRLWNVESEERKVLSPHRWVAREAVGWTCKTRGSWRYFGGAVRAARSAHQRHSVGLSVSSETVLHSKFSFQKKKKRKNVLFRVHVYLLFCFRAAHAPDASYLQGSCDDTRASCYDGGVYPVASNATDNGFPASYQNVFGFCKFVVVKFFFCFFIFSFFLLPAFR